ncbi:MAG: DUF2851 family protein [Bacteroidetes bacterium]|nr:DUF2851 family protein [Bacteroidota bacterium]
MNERLLQFIWQFQYFQKRSLQTTMGDVLQVDKPGTCNQHQGPDFSEADIRVGNTRWVGNVEIHIRSSDWHKHRHGTDGNYGNIILHVVWEDDLPLYDTGGNRVATLVLQPLVPKIFLERYRQMMETMVMIPCHPFLPVLDPLGWFSWKERLAAERLERRAKQILTMVASTANHWEEVCWRMLAANFGSKVNGPLFEMVAKTIPVQLLARHKNQVQQLEALLLGQANLLGGKYEDDYAILLQKEYRFLKKKYRLETIHKSPAFLRMRPASFPTIRLAQLAMLVHRLPYLFSTIKETADLYTLMDHFMVTANDYWHYHYRFDEAAAYQHKHLGKQMAENIFINTVLPLLFAYGLYSQEEPYKERAIRWMYEMTAEQNQITRQWQRLGIAQHSAVDSQALIELTNHYCIHRRCLDCAVGNRILKNDVL